MKKLLVVAHTPSNNTRTLLRALEQGFVEAEAANLAVTVLSPLDASSTDVIDADGIFLFAIENFGYMNGLLKDFFERIYYPCLEKTQGLPYCLCVRAGQDGSGAVQSIERIVTGLRWRKVQGALILKGSYEKSFEQEVASLGQAFAAGLDMNIF